MSSTLFLILKLSYLPFLIYRSALTDIMRASNPYERIYIKQEEKDDVKIYYTNVASSFVLESMNDEFADSKLRVSTWYYNPRLE